MSDAGTELLSVVRDVVGEPLRDCWVFSDDDERAVFVREDVRESLAEIDPEPYIDNERYGYITRATYEDLTYAEYEYTVRGFDSFETFRTFLDGIGLLVSTDSETDVDFSALYAALAASDVSLAAVLADGAAAGDSGA